MPRSKDWTTVNITQDNKAILVRMAQAKGRKTSTHLGILIREAEEAENNP